GRPDAPGPVPVDLQPLPAGAGRPAGRAARPVRAAAAGLAVLPQPAVGRRGRHAGRQGAVGAPPPEGPHDLRAVAVLLHAEHDERGRHGRRARPAPRPPLRPARDQGRRRGARLVPLPDDPDRGQEAGPAGVRGGAGPDRADAGAGTGVAGRAPRGQAGHLPGPAPGRGRHRRQPGPPRGRADGAAAMTAPGPAGAPPVAGERLVGMDVGSTTVEAVAVADGRTLWRDYRRHNTRQAETVAEFLGRMEAECGLRAGRDRIFFTGSGAGFIAPLVGGRFVQEVVAVAAAVERLHPDGRFVAEIGGEDMKTIFFTATRAGQTKQVYMQSACSGGTGTFIEKTARKLQIAPEALAGMAYAGRALHKISSKCGIFAEADAN